MMKTGLGAILVALACIFSVCSSASSQTSVVAQRITLHAEKGWQDSGISLKAGQYYSVSARGYWVSGSEPNFTGPEGQGFGTINNNALLGMIKKTQPEILGYESYRKEIISGIVLIGKGGEFRSYADGNLWLAMGEWSGCKECRGVVEALIVVYE